MLTNLTCGALVSFDTCEADLISTANDTRLGATYLGVRLVSAYRHW